MNKKNKKMKTNNTVKYLEAILKLSKLLIENEVEHTLDLQLDGYSVRIENEGEILADAAIHSGTYGHNEGLFEIFGAVPKKGTKVCITIPVKLEKEEETYD